MARKASGNLLRDYGGTILAAGALAFLIRFLLIEPFLIPSSSMRPTLERGDVVFVSKLPFLNGRLPQRGEVVLFSPSEDSKQKLIKRVIGLEGDLVQVKNGKVFLNQKPLTLKMEPNELCGTESVQDGKFHGVCWEPPTIENFGPQKIPPGSLFLMSDLRTGATPDNSKNQVWGIFPISGLKGKVVWIGISIQPQPFGESTGGLPRFRYQRMFRRVQ